MTTAKHNKEITTHSVLVSKEELVVSEARLKLNFLLGWVCVY
jgi:hypothetical protein